jgi:hypothetical protein
VGVLGLPHLQDEEQALRVRPLQVADLDLAAR